ncbi:carbonic anhydrase 6-like [Dermatophagoides farinae]|uniref:carbonic anhydrase 6-like n=1 Tax=Dermatophagoides farinae TaxID=6954 RepID=UPI003F5E8B72
MSINNSMNKFSLFTFILILHHYYEIEVDAFQKWTYNDQKSWSDVSKECDDINQSPINIRYTDLIFNESLKIEFRNYNQPSANFRATNHGRSVQFDYIGNSILVPTITGSALNDEEFALEQFHFHWGIDPKIGSEHRINGHIYPIEMHLIHYNNKKYRSYNQALDARNGNVAVLAIFFNINKNDNDYNPGFDIISKKIQQLQTTHTNHSIDLQDQLILQLLLPNNTASFYRYHGSVTTPPCTSNVTWLIMDDPNEIEFNQYEKFLNVIDHKSGKKIGNNFRRLQEPNGRRIECSFLNNNAGGGSGDNHPPHKNSVNITMVIIFTLIIVDIVAFLTISKIYMFK